MNRRKTHISAEIDQRVIERVRNAVYWTPGLKVGSFIEKAVSHAIQKLEEERGAMFESRKAKGGDGPEDRKSATPLVKIEVVEIYPYLDSPIPKELKEQGTCDISIRVGEFYIEIRNIQYKYHRDGSVLVEPPMSICPDPTQKNKHISAPSIVFKNPKLCKKIKEVVEREVIEFG